LRLPLLLTQRRRRPRSTGFASRSSQDTVLAYVELCGATQALRVAGEQVRVQERSVAAIRSQLRAGEVSPPEVSQAANLLETTRATIAPYEALQANARYRIATLQGRPPADARTDPIICSAPPKLGATVPVGDGQALLLRRPDIREAERRIAAAAARIGVARADLYPRVNLGGAVGLLTGNFVARPHRR
jgi:outer membrane protein TolC